MEKLENLKIEEKLKKQLLDEWFLNKEEYKKVWIKKIKENIYAVWNKNLWFYLNENWDTIFDLVWIYKDLWKEKYTNYLKKLWYKEEKDKNWYYHMINIKTWKELNQTSYEYYKLFEILNNITDISYVHRTIFLEWKIRKVLNKEDYEYLIKRKQKEFKPMIEKMVNFFNTLKPIELIFLEKHNIILKEEYNKLKKKVYSFEYIKKLIENPVWNYVKWEEKEYKINWKTYKIKTNWITEDELKLYLDLKIINKEDYEVLNDLLEKEKLEQEKWKHIEKTRKHISSLGDDVVSSLV